MHEFYFFSYHSLSLKCDITRLALYNKLIILESALGTTTHLRRLVDTLTSLVLDPLPLVWVLATGGGFFLICNN